MKLNEKLKVLIVVEYLALLNPVTVPLVILAVIS